MSQFLMVAVVGLMLLLPLLPASAIFYLLKTRQERLKDRAPGLASGVFNVLGFKMSFEAAGSTATYLTLLGFATFLFLHMEALDRHERDKDKQDAWLVQIPVLMKDASGKDIAPGSYEYTQIKASVTPYSVLRANKLSLWVTRQDGAFPALNLEVSGTPPKVVDLNDSAIAQVQDGNRIVVQPATIQLLAPYNASGGGVPVVGTAAPLSPAPAATTVAGLATPQVPGAGQ
ncbi:hypothetical protein P6166_12895 [Stenotrophomonas sp. HITSZ_GD]|uniref:hypothetical protein n=1 Tax=Stenotrophomonas sp. HITSZ_GD TaxID=3037248 RepID=UPI00240D8FD0|nr:hypothetical protein [Stenotrophomonas sp. HITSZ_GD]MDG2526252.1 hypothetical protein [Stenotrophomonas sp. HITSZ_GD]